MQRRKAKDDLFAAFATAAKALANGRRAEIVDVLAQGERSVDDLAAEIGQSVANTSQHLQVLARTGLVASRRAGPRVFYRLAGERVLDLWLAVRDVASEHVANVEVLADAYLGNRSELESIDIDELATRLAAGTVVLLDVRPARRVQRRAPPRCRLRAHRRPRGACERSSAGRDRGLLPRALLRLRRRRRATAAGARARRPPARRRCRGVAASGAPRRGVHLSGAGEAAVARDKPVRGVPGAIVVDAHAGTLPAVGFTGYGLVRVV